MSIASSLCAAERETVIRVSDADQQVHIDSARRKDIVRLRQNPRVTEVASGFHGGTEWAQFTIPAKDWNPVSGIKRTVNMTPEQRAVNVERLRQANQQKTEKRQIRCGPSSQACYCWWEF